MPVSSWPAQAGRPRSRARSATSALVLGRVDRERAADRDRACSRPLRARRARRRRAASSRPRGGVEEGVLGVQRRARARARGRRRACACARARRSGSAPMPITPTRRDVALEQRVHRLRRREGDELDARARRRRARRAAARSASATPSATPSGARRAWSGTTACARSASGCALDRDRLREGAADVDADADRPRARSRGRRLARRRAAPPHGADREHLARRRAT